MRMLIYAGTTWGGVASVQVVDFSAQMQPGDPCSMCQLVAHYMAGMQKVLRQSI